MKRIAALIAFFFGTAPIDAHPHIFVDTGLDLYFSNDGRLQSVKVTWRYDAFYSLLITQDMGLDLDGDSVLTPEENTKLHGFDMQWDAGFDGDLRIAGAQGEIQLSAPRDYSAAFVLGRITTVHTRDVQRQNGLVEMLKLLPYDPTYYTAYDINFPVTLHGFDGCGSQVTQPEQTSALMALQQELSTMDPDIDPVDVGLGNVGALLSPTVTVICAAS